MDERKLIINKGYIFSGFSINKNTRQDRYALVCAYFTFLLNVDVKITYEKIGFIK